MIVILREFDSFLAAFLLLSELLLDDRPDLLYEPDGSLNCIIVEVIFAEKPIQDRLDCVLTN